jgi:peptidoglycan/xylan/chitin deacetylase (PgdA/CDA1 family)
LFNPLLDGFWFDRLRGKVTCLLYHRVDAPEHYPFLKVPVIPPEALEKELGFLTAKGAAFFTAGQLLRGSFPGPDQAGFMITFDDCFLDNYTTGLGVLEKLGIKGTFFQSTDMVDGKSLIWEHAMYWFVRDERSARDFTAVAHQTLAEYPRALRLAGPRLVAYLIGEEEVPFEKIAALIDHLTRRPDCRDELSEIANKVYPKAGHLQQACQLGHEVGSHGHSHHRRKIIGAELFERELALSSDIITKTVGRKPDAFSYPFNSYAEGDKALCAKYFSQVFTVDGGPIELDTDRLSLPRFTWPGPTDNPFRRRRWLLTGTV